MPRRGGASTIAGVDYQLSITALELVKGLLDGRFISLQAEAFFSTDIPETQEGVSLGKQLAGVDDLVIKSATGDSYFNIKKSSPGPYWNVEILRREGVWSQFQDQHLQTPNAALCFVTESGVDKNLIECIERLRSKPLGASVESWLVSKTLYAIYRQIIKSTPLISAEGREKFLQRINLKPGINEQDVLENIDLLCKGRFLASNSVKFILKSRAAQWAKTNKVVAKKDIEQALSDEGIFYKSERPISYLLKGFLTVSADLLSVPFTIGKEAVYVERAESKKITDWLSRDLTINEAPIAVVVGGAGTGKTVILRDILNTLSGKSIPVVGLKADRLNSSTNAGLISEIQSHGLGEDFLNALAKLCEENDLVVVLIDQLDALSQSLSADRSSLQSYMSLIELMKGMRGVRIVLSCRPSDLSTDPMLQRLERLTKVEVKDLPDSDVADVLLRHNIIHAALSPALRQLLRVPLHLDIFCQLDAEPENLLLNNLQDLYRKLYDQKVIRAESKLLRAKIRVDRLKDLLNDMALNMSSAQTLTLPALPFDDKFTEEVEYAISQGLVARAGRNLQFFHQSFFDFLFARQFVMSGKQLSAMLKAAHQGLFIRSSIRQILSYLREYNQDEFLVEVQTIIEDDFRFHIKLLAIQQLAAVLNPSDEEKRLVRDVVFTNISYRKCFIESTRSIGWHHWLLNTKFYDNWVKANYEAAADISFSALLWNTSAVEPGVLLQHLQNQLSEHDTNNKEFQKYASWLLFLTRKSSNPLYPELFTHFFEYFLASDHSRYDIILSDRVAINPEWVSNQLLNEVTREQGKDKRKNPREDHYKMDIIEQLYKLNPYSTFLLCKKLLNDWMNKNRYDENPYYSKEDLDIIPDYKFMSFNPEEKEKYTFHEVVYKLTVSYLTDAAQRDSQLALSLLSGWLNSDLETLLEIVCATFYANPNAFVPQIYEVLVRPGYLAAVKDNNYLNKLFCRLINAAYSAFTFEQQERLNSIIIEISKGGDFRKLDLEGQERPREYVQTWYGYYSRFYLAAIPGDLLRLHTKAYRFQQEMNRRYPKSEVESSWKRRKRPSVEDNKKTNITKMSPENWLAALKEHANPPGIRPWDDYEAGWCSKLATEVKERPSEMKPVLDLLVLDTQLPKSYLYAGVNALAETKCEPNELTEYVLHLTQFESIPNASPTMLIWLGKKCIVNGKVDKRLVDWFIKLALEHINDQKNPESEDYLMDGINCTGGAAVDALVQCYGMKLYRDKIYGVLQRISVEGSLPVRAAAIYHLALLLNETENKVLVVKHFIQLVGKDFKLLSGAAWSLQYLIHHDFEPLLKLFRDAIIEEESHESVATILTRAWLYDISGVLEVLERYWATGAKIQFETFKLVTRSYPGLELGMKDKVKQMFLLFLETADRDLSNCYDVFFTELTPDDFEEFYPLMLKYVDSRAGMGREHFFYEYLNKCVKQFPVECLSLVEQFTSHERPNITENTLNKEALETLLLVYEVLSRKSRKKTILDKAMDVFDQMLQMPEYRTSAHEALVEVDRY